MALKYTARVGEFATTYDGHCGFIEKVYRPTGCREDSVHIREADGRIYYCPVSNLLIGGDYVRNTEHKDR